ncbi:MAG: ThiF family adenylyltransferase [Minisyncoccia bacterium]
MRTVSKGRSQKEESTVLDWKTAPLFMRAWQEDRDIHIVGAGALGSRYAVRLIGDGAERVHVHDHDEIEDRNTLNQPLYRPYIGEPKAIALQKIAIEMGCGHALIPHVEKITGPRELSGIILLGLDSNAERRLVTESCAMEKEGVTFLGDGRMGASGGKAYGLDPRNTLLIDRFLSKEHLDDDPVENLGGCVQTPAASATADIVAGHVLWRLGRRFHFEQGCEDPYVNYLGFEIVPTDYVEVQTWILPE